MSKTKKFALGLFAVAIAYGCSSPQETQNGASEDELGLRSGNVDHAAIVEATTMMLVGPSPVSDFANVLDPYNQDDPFKIHASSYADGFTRNLTKFDAYDNQDDWQPDQATAWVNRMAAGNYLVVDTSKPCDFANPHTYLEIERANLTGQEHQTCGGRMPNEDALDVTLSFLIRGPSHDATEADSIRDGVDQATKKATDTFPYLGEMNGI